MWSCSSISPLQPRTNQLARVRPAPRKQRPFSRPQRARPPACLVLAKQYVPSGGFGGVSPERKAANHLRTLFTFVAVKIILAQLEGSGRGALGSYNSTNYQVLTDFLDKEPLRDGDEWLGKLMIENSLLAVRVMEVREAYADEDFEYDQLERLAKKDMKEANVKLMRSFASDRFASALEAGNDSSSSGSSGATGDTSVDSVDGGTPRPSSSDDSGEPQ